MKDLFYYVFYRASKFYKSWGENNNYYIFIIPCLCLQYTVFNWLILLYIRN